MTDETIVAVYDTTSHAEAAVASLKSAGVPAESIEMHANEAGMSTATSAMAPVREEGFWANLFGGSPDHDTSVYDRSVAGGSTVVSVKVPETHVARVLEIMENHHPIDIDERAASYGMSQAAATATPMVTPAMPVAAPVAPPAATVRSSAGTTGADATLQLSEETLAVGKRVANLGGTRVRRFVVETPVEENVSLHSERVVLDRRPVTDGRPVDADFTEKTIEMTETAEEAVVSKTARVYEEVGLRKEVSDRVETVRDTVRKEEAEVVQVPGTATASTVTPVTTKTATTKPATTTTGATDDKLPPRI